MSSKDDFLSRRQMLRWSAMASSALAVGAACGPGTTPADGGGGGGDASDSGGGGSDVTTLNALLSAEYQAIKAYDAGAMILGAPPMGDMLASLAPTLLMVAGRFQQQHRDHAMALAATVTAAGGTPVQESSVMFTAPAGFTPGVANVLKLAANAEKAAAIAYNRTVRQLNARDNRFLASSIEGDETQHYIVLYVILKGTAAPGMNIGMVNQIVPTSYVSTVLGMAGLQSVMDFTYA